MIELAKKHFKKVIRLCGANRDCKYYPCHFDNQVCLWCFCPFYPCYDEELGEFILGKKGSKVWSCIKCSWIHRPDVACEVLREILEVLKDRDTTEALDVFEDRELLMDIMKRVREKFH